MMSSRRVVDLRPRGKAEPERKVPNVARERPNLNKRPAPLRIRRRRKRVLIAASVALVVGGLVAFASWLSYLPEFAIQHIEVVGADMVKKEEITQRIDAILDDGSRHLFSRRNIFLYPRKEIEFALVGDFPRIKSLSIARSKQFANSLIVRIGERTTYAQWCVRGLNCYAVDDRGYVFARYIPFVDALPATAYVFYGSSEAEKNIIGQLAIPEHFKNLIVLLELLRKEGYLPGAVEIIGGDVHITLEAFMIKVSFGQDPEQLMKNLQLILSSEPLKSKKNQIEYIDLRFDNRVYYKLNGQDESSSGASDS